MNRTSGLTALSLLLCGALSACAQSSSVPPAAELAAETQARLYQPVPEKSVIYLLRDRGDIWRFEIKVQLDGKGMGATEPNTYFRWEVPPGRHVIVSETVPPAVLELNTQPGGLYYVWQDINFGFLRVASRLEQVDIYTAKLTLSSAVLLKNP